MEFKVGDVYNYDNIMNIEIIKIVDSIITTKLVKVLNERSCGAPVGHLFEDSVTIFNKAMGRGHLVRVELKNVKQINLTK